MKSPKVFDPLTRLQCCPTSDGSAAAILVSEDFVIKHNLQANAVEIIGAAMTTDFPSSFEKSCIKAVGSDMTRAAAQKVYAQTGIGPDQVQVIELHDCFSCNEMLTYEALGLCPEGQGGRLIDEGQVTYGGKWVVNPSGGLISKGHPLGATGLAQCAELCWQIRGMAGKRQVSGAKVALQHNLGLGGAAVVAMYRHGFPAQAKPFSGLINPAIQDPAAAPKSAPVAPITPAGFKSDATFKQLAERIASDASAVGKIQAIFRFDVRTGADRWKSWTLDLKNGSGSLKEGTSPEADCTISMLDDDFVLLFTGALDPQTAFMQKKLKFSGNMQTVLKLKHLVPPKSKL